MAVTAAPRAQSVVEYVSALGVKLPPIESFWRLGDQTALRVDGQGSFYRANYERGILLYALVAALRPVSALEFGTGRGYGCLCMAWAMADHGIDGRVHSVDVVGQDQPFEWLLDRGDGPTKETLTRTAVWRAAAPSTWTDRIIGHTGWSGRVMARWTGPSVEFAYIDAGHGFDTVRHDFYSTLDIRAPRLGVLFDDYGGDPSFGVQRLIDQEVAAGFDATLIRTDRCWPGGQHADHPPAYGMVWMHTDSARAPVDELFPPIDRAAFLRSYRRRERVGALRHRIGRMLRRS